MIDSHYIQLSFNNRLKRARVQFPAGECFRNRRPPHDIIARVKDRFRDDLAEGHIETYSIFEDRFVEFWEQLHDMQGEIDPNHVFRFTLGQGGRIYDEIVLTPDPSTGSGFKLSCRFPPKKISTIPYNAFLFNVMKRLETLGATNAVDRAQLRYLFYALQQGRPLENVPLLLQPERSDAGKRGYLVRVNQDLGYASLHIYDSFWIKDAASCQLLMVDLKKELEKRAFAALRLEFIADHTYQKLLSLTSKTQAVGFALPYDLLIAYTEKARISSDQLSHSKRMDAVGRESLHARKPARGVRRVEGDFLTVDISPSGMEARLVYVNDKVEPLRETLDQAWLLSEWQKIGLRVGVEPYIPEILKTIQDGREFGSLVAAKGQLAQKGSRAEIRWLHGSEHADSSPGSMRDRQNKKIVWEGEALADFIYADGQPGLTVEGRSFPAKATAIEAGYTPGEGVEWREDETFYAKRSGLLVEDGRVITCSAAYTHKGSINLASGNLRFEGTVIVEGDVEEGSSVEVHGTLLVQGSIGAAQVICSGDVQVKGGVVTGKKGSLKVGGSADIGFIENSVVEVGKDLIVQRSLLHSRVICGGKIVLGDTQPALITGGVVCAWEAIVCHRVGSPDGSSTQIRLGSNFQDERRLLQLVGRLRRMQAALDERQKSLKLMSRVKSASDETLKYTEDCVKRLDRIVDKLSQRKKHQERRIAWNKDAILLVKETLDKNSTVWLDAKKLELESSLRGVVVTPLISKHLLDADHIEDLVRRHPQLEALKLSA